MANELSAQQREAIRRALEDFGPSVQKDARGFQSAVARVMKEAGVAVTPQNVSQAADGRAGYIFAEKFSRLLFERGLIDAPTLPALMARYDDAGPVKKYTWDDLLKMSVNLPARRTAVLVAKNKQLDPSSVAKVCTEPMGSRALYIKPRTWVDLMVAQHEADQGPSPERPAAKKTTKDGHGGAPMGHDRHERLRKAS